MLIRPKSTHAGTQARLVRAAAGAPALVRRTRRGSFLVLVVGTLALLAVVAIIYVTIGNQDMRTRAAVARQDHLEETPRNVADYLAGVIAADRTATYLDSSAQIARDASGRVSLTRETTDYPSIDIGASSTTTGYSYQTTAGAGFVQFPFDPAGRYDPKVALNAEPAYLSPTDPWLASPVPTFIAGAPFANPGTGPDKAFSLVRGWEMISNFAPDGRFVNLFNLRRPPPREGFSTRPGNDMASLLTLLNPDGGPSSQTDWGQNLDLARPYMFTARQLYAYRPIGSQTGLDWGDGAYLPYQWCDTDGDGFYDARWFELVDSRGGWRPKTVLPRDDRYRYFIAARAVDLSARVNVNTAADFRTAPDENTMAGQRPADVDLERLLTLYDPMEMYAGATAPLNKGYGGIYQVAGRSDDYSYNNNAALSWNLGKGFEVGHFGYTSLRLALAGGVTPPASYPAVTNRMVGDPGGAPGQLASGFMNYLGRTLPNSEWYFEMPGVNPRARTDYYDRRSRDTLGAYMTSGTDFDARSGFTLDSLAELLTYFGLNDPGTTSELEAAEGGRSETGMDPERRFSSLRANRAFDIESRRNVAGAGNEATPEVMLLRDLDPRRHLTTISGAAPLRPFRGVVPGRLTPSDLRVDAISMLEQFALVKDPGSTIPPFDLPRAGPLCQVFQAYADALLPCSGFANSWRDCFPGGAFAPTPLNQLSYGYRGPAAAAIVAAHQALNLADSYDTDNSPSIATLLFNYDEGANIPADRRLPPDQQKYTGAARNNVFFMPRERAGRSGDSIPAPFQGINVYGIEAQPFLTQVGSFTSYCDVGDDEGNGQPITIKGTLDRGSPDFLYRVLYFQLTNPFNTPVVLSSSAWKTHKNLGGGQFQDGIFTASQFDVDDPAFPQADGELEFYYIEFGGRYYKLAALTAQGNVGGMFNNPPAGGGSDTTLTGITIQPGETIICYALSDMPKAILDRLLAASPSTSRLRSDLEKLLRNRMDDPTKIAGVYWVGPFDKQTGRYALSTPPVLASFATPAGGTVNLYRTVRTGDELLSQPATAPATQWDGVTPPAPPGEPRPPWLYRHNFLENDQLIDRFRMPTAGIDHKLPIGNNTVAGTVVPTDNTGWTITVGAVASRRRDPNAGAAIPIGAIPGYCIEPKYAAGWNDAQTYGPAGSPARSDFDGSPGPGGQDWHTVASWRADLMNVAISSTRLAEPPRSMTTANAVGTNAAGVAYTALYPEIPVDDRKFARTPAGGTSLSLLRPADFLLPLGTGPMSNFAPGLLPDARWTTLGEALAGALGYDQAPPGNSDISTLLWLKPGGGAIDPILDRGNLKLDAYVPFIDFDLNGVYSPARNANSDVLVGGGVPPAMVIPDLFYTSIGGVAPSLTRAEPGKVNVNTMPVRVARVIPFLSPAPANIPPPLGGAWWWWTGAGALDDRADAAAAIVALRDKNAVLLRPLARGANGGKAYLSQFMVNSPSNRDPFDVSFSPGPLEGGRARTSQIVGLHETRGFSVTGEILAARVRGGGVNPDAPFNIDHLGFDTANNSRRGVALTLARDPIDPAHPEVPDTIRDSYKERLTVASAALPSLTTRSDYFAVWFVIHGYQKSDIEGLAGNRKPMVPSIARRFLMIVDRSNVTRDGDKPNILLFKELPYTPE